MTDSDKPQDKAPDLASRIVCSRYDDKLEDAQAAGRAGDDAARQVFEEATAAQVYDPKLKAYIDSGYPAPAGALAGGMKRERGQPFVMNEPHIAYEIPLTPGELIHTFEDGCQIFKSHANGSFVFVKPGTLLTDAERVQYAREYMERSKEVSEETLKDTAPVSEDAPILVTDVNPHDGPVQAFGHTTSDVPMVIGQAEEAPVKHDTFVLDADSKKVFSDKDVSDLLVPATGKKNVGTIGHVNTRSGYSGSFASNRRILSSGRHMAAMMASALLANSMKEEAGVPLDDGGMTRLQVEQEVNKLHKRLESLMVGKKRQESKKLIARFKDANFGAVMSAKLHLSPKTLPGQNEAAIATGENVIRWVHASARRSDLSGLRRVLGEALYGAGQYHTWSYETFMRLACEVFWKLVVKTPEACEGHEKFTSSDRLGVMKAAIDQIEVGLTGRLAK